MGWAEAAKKEHLQQGIATPADSLLVFGGLADSGRIDVMELLPFGLPPDPELLNQLPRYLALADCCPQSVDQDWPKPWA